MLLAAVTERSIYTCSIYEIPKNFKLMLEILNIS